MRAVSPLTEGTGQATDVLPALGLIVIAMGSAKTAARGIGRTVLIVAPLEQRLGVEVLVSPIVGKEGDAALVVQPAVVGGDIISGVAEVNLSGCNGHGQALAVCDAFVALMGIGRVGGVAKRQLQGELAVEIGGLEMAVAKDAFCLRRVLGVDGVADFGLKVRGHFGTAGQQPPLGCPGSSPWLRPELSLSAVSHYALLTVVFISYTIRHPLNQLDLVVESLGPPVAVTIADVMDNRLKPTC